jgi:uncharacterized membrane protein YccC
LAYEKQGKARKIINETMESHYGESQPLLASRSLLEQDLQNHVETGDINFLTRRNKFQATLSRIESESAFPVEESSTAFSILSSACKRFLGHCCLFSTPKATNNHDASRVTTRRLFQPPIPVDDALYFGARVALILLLGSLFATNTIPFGYDVSGHDIDWPEGMWVTISALMVCWFPKLDAASVVEKSIQRLVGTLLGGAMALFCGKLSRFFFVKNVMRRQVFLHTIYALACFVVTYLSMKIRLTRTVMIMDK